MGLHPVIKNDLDFILAASIDDLNALAGSRIFITGGTGFFGKWLLHAFEHYNDVHEQKIHVTVLSRNPDAFLHDFPFFAENQCRQYIQGDVIDLGDLAGNYDYVVHAAADATNGRNPGSVVDIHDPIVGGATNVMRFCKKAKVRRVLFVSSGAVYGSTAECIDEGFEEISSDVSQYGAAKRIAELIFSNANDFDTVIARCFSFCGPYLPLNGPYAFGNFIDDAINERQILIKGNGKSIRSYLYAADLVVWLLRLLVRGQKGNIINVGSPVALSVLELAKQIASRANSPLQPKILGAEDGVFSFYVPEVSKARNKFGLEVFTPIKDAIDRTFKFYS